MDSVFYVLETRNWNVSLRIFYCRDTVNVKFLDFIIQWLIFFLLSSFYTSNGLLKFLFGKNVPCRYLANLRIINFDLVQNPTV